MMLLDRGTLGPSWHIERDRLAPVKEALRAGSVSRLDCAWDERVEVRPGFVNAHTHLYSGLASFGMPAPKTQPANFVEILQRVWWRLDRALDEQTLRASARYAIADALLSGCTALVDHHESPGFIEGSLDVLADAAQSLGVRLAVGYGATERNGGADEARRGLQECERFLKENRRSLVRGMVALHASFTVSDETIRAAGELAWERTAAMHVHVAEDVADVEDAKRRGYEGPLERLLHLEALPPGSVVAHGVHLDVSQVERADGAGVWLVQNPRSNEGNRVGYPSALKASAHVGVGTDGWPAQMETEFAALRRLGQAHGDDAQVLEARIATSQDLASSLFKVHLGEVAAGAPADVTVGVPGERPRHVLVSGRRVVADGKLVTGDLEEIRARAHEAAPALWRRMEALP